MREPIIHLYTLCWDEADMLGFFFRHYDSWVDRYIVFDDGSTDGSRDILRAHPKVELRNFVRVEAGSFVLSQRAMQNQAWKESRWQADWVIVTAIDEHLHVRNRSMRGYLSEQSERGVTLVPALGFDMNHPVMPEDRGHLTSIVTRGRPRGPFNKLGVFKPEALRETGFSAGRHHAEPIGELRLPARDELMLWHYKHLGFERNAAREASQALRLGPIDIASDFGHEYWLAEDGRRSFWDEMERDSIDLATKDSAPDEACIRPLWWDEPRAIARASNERLPPIASGPIAENRLPKISVLIKTPNHARHVRQAITSILDQSFQDFEIIVTDDGSNDNTARVLNEFTDARIRINVLPQNLSISAAMDATVARARGSYLAIVNSDEWMLPGRLRKQAAFLDANPDVALVFSLPRTIDEEGLPVTGLDDFRLPFGFPDFSRRSWLRQFFYSGNCLCAPTAMIRREAYAAAGAYDRRLTNLQDFDMWIRMLIAGHNIHVLEEPLTAFRIRDNNANASAPALETRLRSHFETGKILRHFAGIDEALFDEVFGVDLVEQMPNASPGRRVAELARRSPRRDLQQFAVDWLYENACDPQDFIDLREWTGSMDLTNLHLIDQLNEALQRYDQSTTDLRQLADTREKLIADLSEKFSREAEQRLAGEQQVADLSRISAERAAQIARLEDEFQNTRSAIASL
ncbi:MAG: glycosyltransferase [Methylobacteriaceae bacterium]|nr:glycosyltransferase [Methylobacteriaceae bacterium]